jgi:hypothetical protein
MIFRMMASLPPDDPLKFLSNSPREDHEDLDPPPWSRGLGCNKFAADQNWGAMRLFLVGAAFLLLFQTCMPSALLQGEPAVARRLQGIRSLTAPGPGSSYGHTTRRRRQCKLLPLQRRLRGGGGGGGGEGEGGGGGAGIDWNDDDDMSLSSISFSGSDAFGLGRAADNEQHGAGAEYRQYIEDREDVDLETIGKVGSSFAPGQGDVVNIRCQMLTRSLLASPILSVATGWGVCFRCADPLSRTS